MLLDRFRRPCWEAACFVVLLCIVGTGWAQPGSPPAGSTRVFGTVTDQITGETLMQAVVLWGTQGVTTQLDGRYEMVLPAGTHTLKVSYVGYEPLSKTIQVQGGQLRVDFALSSVVLGEAQVVADVAIERETPVAFSNITPLKIQEELGSQPIPMILNTTPGVYATQAGSDDSGPSISIRGFKQRNVSVLVDGIPVNDMESGGVFWNNWFGLDLVTQTMQVQRGLGASKLALPAIGGTVNIITQGIESARKTSVKQEVGSFGMTRTSIGHTSGRLPGGWGYTLSASFQNRQGFFEQDYNRSWFYYGKVQRIFGDHTLSLSATGAPTENAVRSYQQRIATHDLGYARSLFRGDDAAYERMRGYSQAYDAIFNDGSLTQPQEAAAVQALNEQYGYNSVADFENEMSTTNFIDTTGVVAYGRAYNVHWGMLNGEPLVERINQYHKPLFSLRHNWRVNDAWYLSNMLYASYGYGGGTRLDNSLGAGDYTPDGQVDFDKFYRTNTVGGLFGPPIDPTYSNTLLKSSRILRKSFNNHQWFGALSTFRYAHSEEWTFSGGVDFRTYRGEHYAEVYDLLGGDYFVDAFDKNAASKMRQTGDKIGYHNDALVRWGGFFGLAEYKGFLYNLFLNVSGVYQGYRSIDFFAPLDVVIGENRWREQLSYGQTFIRNEDTGATQVADAADVTLQGEGAVVDGETIARATVIEHGGPGSEYTTSGWKWLPGFTVKAGGNYNLTEYTNAFVNLGYLSRTPVFRNVVDFSNELASNIVNEVILSTEIGASYSRYPFSVNMNAYYTDWNNRPLQSLLRFETVEGDLVFANINSMSARHMGWEVDGAWEINRNFTLEGYISLGDWRWTSSEDNLVLLDDRTGQPYLDQLGQPATVTYDAQGVRVGDAPQHQYSLSLKYTHKDFYLRPRYTLFDKYFADFDPFSLNGENAGRQSWQLPTYGLLEIHAGYNFDWGTSNFDIRLSLFNVLNTTYINNAQNNDAFGQYYFTDTDRRYAFATNNFDAASAAVYMGPGFQSNLSLRVRF